MDGEYLAVRAGDLLVERVDAIRLGVNTRAIPQGSPRGAYCDATGAVSHAQADVEGGDAPVAF